MAALLLPLGVFHRVTRHAATHLVACDPSAPPLGDPALNGTATARAWARWERGILAVTDDRVFAPIPDAVALGEFYPLPALAAYPFARLFHSTPLGVNVTYYLGLVFFPVALYALYAHLAGPGLGAFLAALVVAYGPARLNQVGVVATLHTAFVVLAFLAALRFLENGRRRDLLVFGASILVQALSSLYGLATGGLWAAVTLVLFAFRRLRDPARTASLAGTGLVALGLAAVYNLPYARVGHEVGVRTTRETFERFGADLLSLVHGGTFGGPVKQLLERLAPGFPWGAAAFFPTLTLTFLVVFSLVVFRRDRRRAPTLSPWLVSAAICFVLALGPSVRLAGQRLGPGPFALLYQLPVFELLRNVSRFDQFFDISLGAAAALSFAALRRAGVGAAWLPATLCLLSVLDVWPADIPATRFPEPSPYAASLGALPADAMVAVYPGGQDAAVQAWVDQLVHGRRVVNGYHSYWPPLHAWLERTLEQVDTGSALQLFQELGASVVAVDRSRLGARAAEIDALGQRPPGLRVERVSDVGTFRLFFLTPRPPNLIHADQLAGLRFEGASARLFSRNAGPIFRLGPEAVAVRIGPRKSPATLTIPIVGVSPLAVTVSLPVPPGAEVLDASSGRSLGRGVSGPPAPASPASPAPPGGRPGP